MESINHKIIEAVIQKAKRQCPDAVDLIGVYGSAATGDTHPKSDLDLMILINDQRGYQLSETFIIDDIGIGYDLYCTSWAMLEADSECDHAQLYKLLDSKLVYVHDDLAFARLKELQNKALRILSSDVRFEKADAAFERAKGSYAECFLKDSLSDVRFHAGAVINQLLNGVMLFHGRYFRRGTKRVFDEISEIGLPIDIQSLVLNVIRAENVQEIRNCLTLLMQGVRDTLEKPKVREVPSAANICGTYEESFSNWRNKMPEAAENKDLYSSFMNMAFFQYMLMEIAETVEVQMLNVLECFDPCDLYKNVNFFDSILNRYLDEYCKIGIQAKKYKDIDAFIESYLS